MDWLSPAELNDKRKASGDDFVVLDVREGKEVKESRIPRSQWIPLDQLEKRLGELDKNKEIAVHCHSGLRAYKACLKLKHYGFTRVENVDGGLLCWSYDLEGEKAKG